MADAMKTCPYCAEPIRAAAKVCRHCLRDLDTGEIPAAALARRPGAAPSRTLWVLLAVSGALVLLGTCQ